MPEDHHGNGIEPRGSGAPVRGETAAARLRRVVEEAKAKHSGNFERCLEVWVENMNNPKVSPGERRKNAQALAKHLDVELGSPSVTIDQRRQSVEATVQVIDPAAIQHLLKDPKTRKAVDVISRAITKYEPGKPEDNGKE